jgi:hypothetical protein
MVQALGFAIQQFKASYPGRLCRGQERWIAYENMLPSTDKDDESDEICRTVVSGAAFTDDSARDALRGLRHVDVAITAVLRAIAGDGPLYAYCEEGHPLCTPEGALGVEEHTVTRPGGSLHRWAARWTLEIVDDADVQRAMDAGAEVFLRSPAVIKAPKKPIVITASVPPMADAPERPASPFTPALQDALYLMTGFRAGERPQRRFQPAAIPSVLEHAEAVVLVHLDKHGPCLAAYSTAPTSAHSRLLALSPAPSVFLVVPFAIPPMLARWDRALWELRQDWDATTHGDFPVPPSRGAERQQAHSTEE